jgi:hypothetical protein
MSGTAAKHPRVTSSTTLNTLKRYPLVNLSYAKSRSYRAFA